MNSNRIVWRLRACCVVLLLAGLIGVPASVAQEADGRLAKLAAAKNSVESRGAGQQAWNPAAPGLALFGNDRVRTGEASRAAILYADDTLHRVDEKSEVEIVPQQGEKQGLLKVLSGRHYFSSRKPKNFGRVETATVTAAIKGTEFAVEVAADGTTTVTMIEGVVEASNEYGTVEIGAGERAVAEPGKAPVRSVVVRPRDAVMWAFAYPPVLGGRDAKRLDGMGAKGDRLEKAAAALGAGQVDAARRELDAAGADDDPVALSLRSIVELVADRKDEARALAQQALSSDEDSSSANLAASLVAQADFDIARAATYAERAAELDPEDPIALSRAAEMRLAQGDVPGARAAAREALRRDADSARALSVMGFIELGELRSARAATMFGDALRSDSDLADAHLGLGIAQLRGGDLAAGLESIQAAAALDPSNSLYRSYLAKAYYEERRPDEALKELAAAKELDPSDPTPYLYAALILQNENRPVEAMDELLKSIERNDNRAVYRSRLLLDQDAAVRGADLARIINDLGFEEAGLVFARRSADQNQANHSSHLLLAGAYRNEPTFAPAFLSEVLQARIYQPVSVNAARPDLVNASASLNEYTALVNRPRFRAFGTLAYGETDTDLSAFDNGTQCGNVSCTSLSEIDDSEQFIGAATVTHNGDRHAVAASYSTIENDGFRVNSDEETETFTLFAQGAVSRRDTLQINAIFGERENGDLPLRQLLPAVTPERFDTSETNIGLGWHRQVAPGADLAVSAIWNETEQTAKTITGIERGTATLSGPQIEAQWVQQLGAVGYVIGIGAFDGEFELASPGSTVEADDLFANAYGYVRWRPTREFEVTGGLAIEHVDSPIGLLPPRDSNILTADVATDDTQLSPKLGVTVTLDSGTTLRAAAIRRLAPFLGRLQTLEPTQVAGFNQFFEDVGGTESWTFGTGIDQRLARRWFIGASYFRRNLDVPEAFCDLATEGSIFSGCAFVVPSLVREVDREEDRIRAYVSRAFADRFAASLDYDLDLFDFDTTATTPTGTFQDRIETQRIRPEFRYFSPTGVFVQLSSTYYDQEVDQFDTIGVPDRMTVDSEFWVHDAQVGYRFPKRWGSFVIEARNLTNRKFEFYQRTIQEMVIPARAVVARLEITY